MGVAVNEPIDPVVRLAISQWPDDLPRGAVSTFCAEHGISRKSFYELRKRAKTDSPSAVLEPRTRRPKTSPSALSDAVKAQAVAVRAGFGGFRARSWTDQRARQDALDGARASAVHGVAGTNLPRGRRRPSRAEEEAPLSVATVCLSRSERMLATRWHGIGADRWA